MGNNVELSISLDAWQEIRKHPEQLVQQIDDKGVQVHGGGKNSVIWGAMASAGNHANPLTIHRYHHADISMLYLADRGSFVNLSDVAYTPGALEKESNLDLLESQLKMANRTIITARAMIKEERARRI